MCNGQRKSRVEATDEIADLIEVSLPAREREREIGDSHHRTDFNNFDAF
jgi:hypothetical protein